MPSAGSIGEIHVDNGLKAFEITYLDDAIAFAKNLSEYGNLTLLNHDVKVHIEGG